MTYYLKNNDISNNNDFCYDHSAGVYAWRQRSIANPYAERQVSLSASENMAEMDAEVVFKKVRAIAVP